MLLRGLVSGELGIGDELKIGDEGGLIKAVGALKPECLASASIPALVGIDESVGGGSIQGSIND